MRDILRLSFHKDPVTIDPQKSGDKLSSALIFLLYKGLTRLEADHTIHCDLSDSYQILNNYKKYVFYLGEHVWSDGTPITAYDFVYSWKRALAPSFPLRAIHFFYHLKNAKKAKEGLISLEKVGVYAKSDKVLEVELEYPCPYFLELTSFCLFFPVAAHAREGEGGASSIYSGPFQLENWIPTKEIYLKKNPHCKASSFVFLNAIDIRIIPNEKQAFTLFENGQLDWIGNPISPLPVSYLPSLVSSKQVKPIAGITCCWFNTNFFPFSNVNLRKALAHAIPRERILKKLLLPNALSAKSFIPKIFNHSKPFALIEESKESAKRFFDMAAQEMNIKHLTIVLSYEATEEFSRIASLLKTYWEEALPLYVQLEPMHFKEFWQVLPQHKFQLSLVCSVSQYNDPVNFLEKLEFQHAPINFSGWESKDYQAVLRRYRKTTDQKKRKPFIEKAESILFKEMPIAPICYYYYAYMQKDYVKNLTISPIGVMQFDRVSLEDYEQVSSKEFLSFYL